ncbi:MAG TPA: MerR family transcriptional regulator [Chloroflexota bacterium]|nr:MerR family transcriptional regulator [Chloroflexota bacterium]
MSNDTRGLTIEELATAVDLPIRTIRYYIAEGLIAGPNGRGKAALYGEEQKLRLRLIRRLANEHVPLAEIRSRLAGLGADDVATLLDQEESRSTELQVARTAQSPRDYIAALLRNARATGDKPPGRAPTIVGAQFSRLFRAIEESPGQFASSDTSPTVSKAPVQPIESLEPDSSTIRDPSVARTANTARTSWEHLELAPGIVLQIRADARKANRDLIDRLLNIAENPPPH